MQPPRLAAIAHGKLSNRQYFKFRRVQTKHHSHQAIPFSRRNVPARWVRPHASCRSIDAYFSGSKPTRGTAFTREILTKIHRTRITTDSKPTIAWKVRQRANRRRY